MSSTTGEAGSLWQALASAPDHRRDAGKRYPLASLLLIAIAAMLSGRRDQLGIIRWGRRLSHAALEKIGINRQRVPAPSVWCELFQGLDIGALRGGRLGLNSVSVPIDGFPTGPFHRLPLRGIA